MYRALLLFTKKELSDRPQIKGKKKIYYISAEFLIGKLLSNNLINLGIYDELKEGLAAIGKDLSKIEEIEPEPSLGNGGLGRLAACFIDSIATLNLPGDGIGLNYHYGLFQQVFKKNKQTAEKNAWIDENCWLNKTNTKFKVYFGKTAVTSRLYDIDVVGYHKGIDLIQMAFDDLPCKAIESWLEKLLFNMLRQRIHLMI